MLASMKSVKKLIISIFVACGVSFFIPSSYLLADDLPSWHPDNHINREAAEEDLKILFELLETYHPRLFWYQGEASWKISKQNIVAGLPLNPSLIDLYRSTWQVVAKVQDGHTRLFGSDALSLQSLPTLPLDIYWTGHDAVIRQVFDDRLQHMKGSVVTQLNGQPINDIMATIYNRLYSDGGSRTGKKETINFRGFSRWLSLLYDAPENWVMTVEDATGKVTVTTVPSVPLSVFQDRLNSLRPKSRPPIIQYLNNNVALLKFDSFGAQGDFPTFTEWLDTKIEELNASQAEILILDLRDNGGGPVRNAAYLVSALVDQPFYFLNSITTKTKTIPSFKAQGWDPSWFERFESNVGNPLTGGKYDFGNLGGYYPLKQIKPFPSPFIKNVIILMNGYSFSGASDFISVLKANRPVTLIGEETGGARSGNASGFMPMLDLPNSGFRIQMPLLSFQLASGWENKKETVGVVPDVLILPSVEDIRSGSDSLMKSAYSFIGSRLTLPINQSKKD